jgi:hypothetical protein
MTAPRHLDAMHAAYGRAWLGFQDRAGRWSMIVLLSLTTLAQAEDGSLKRAKEELHPPAADPAPAPAPPSPRPSDDGSRTYAGDGDGDVVFFEWLVLGVAACFFWPGDATDGAAVMGAERYPYHDGWHGWYAPAGHGRRGLIYGGEVYAETARIEDDLQRYAIGGRAMLSALMLRTEWNRYLEERADGSHDSLTVGTIDLELGITITAQARLGLGLGATITHDSIGGESGLCGVVALDIFPISPLVLHGVFTTAHVGGTDVTTMRGTIGALWQRYEAYAGWQATHIGGVELEGPTLGARVWF